MPPAVPVVVFAVRSADALEQQASLRGGRETRAARPSQRTSSRVLLAGKDMTGQLSAPAMAVVVEQDEEASDVMTGVLLSLGCRVITTPDPESALMTLRAEERVDLLVTDVVLQGSIDGPELARLAKEAKPGVQIVYSTGYSPMFLLDSEAPPDRLLLRKPWQRNALKTILSHVLSAQRAARDSTLADYAG
jgi:CheY-like chemotaxis protein